MTTRRSILVGTALVAGGLLWYLFRPDALVISKTVHEPFPQTQETASSMNHSPTSYSPSMNHSSTSYSPMSHSSMGQSAMGGSAMAQAANGDSSMRHSSMDESSMSGSGMSHTKMGGSASASSDSRDPLRITSGRFHSNAHETKGVATIYQLDDGRRVLRLTEFSTSNGPDVRVYLVQASDVQQEDAARRAGIVDLGALKGNIGDQNYDVPAGLDLSKYQSVSIWCRRFSVNFGAAPLTATQ